MILVSDFVVKDYKRNTRFLIDMSASTDNNISGKQYYIMQKTWIL